MLSNPKNNGLSINHVLWMLLGKYWFLFLLLLFVILKIKLMNFFFPDDPE
jgi:hypothetical protein